MTLISEFELIWFGGNHLKFPKIKSWDWIIKMIKERVVSWNKKRRIFDTYTRHRQNLICLAFTRLLECHKAKNTLYPTTGWSSCWYSTKITLRQSIYKRNLIFESELIWASGSQYLNEPWKRHVGRRI